MVDTGQQSQKTKKPRWRCSCGTPFRFHAWVDNYDFWYWCPRCDGPPEPEDKKRR